jgi:ABC-2 type transport system permease protein
MRRFAALYKKETLQILRDPSALLVAVVLPLILLFLMGYAISLDIKKIPLGIVLQNPSKHSLSLVGAFEASTSFEVHVDTHANDFKELMQKGALKGIVTIPASFEKDLVQGHPKLQIISDGSEPNSAGFVQKYSAQVWQNWLMQEPAYKAYSIQNQANHTNQISPNTTPPQIIVQTRYWFNSPLLSSYFLLPGSIAIILTLIGTLLTALVVSREWERGTMEAVMSTPVSIVEMLLGKLLPYFVLGMVSMLICVTVSIFWFDIPFRGSFLLLFSASAIYLFPSLSLGLLISTIAKNQFVAAQAALISGFLPAFLLSGFIFQISSMPEWIVPLTHIIPAKYFVTVLQTLFLSGNIAHIIIPNLLSMLLLGSVIFALVIKKTRKRLD